jgi:hypothetical protein
MPLSINHELSAHFQTIDPRFQILNIHSSGNYTLSSTGRTFVTDDGYEYTLEQLRVIYRKCKSGLIFVCQCGTDRMAWYRTPQ